MEESKKVLFSAVIPKKRLSDHAQALIESYNPEEFKVYLQKMIACLSNMSLLAESDIEDALNSLNKILASKQKGRLQVSALFLVISEIAFNFKRELPSKWRLSLVVLQFHSRLPFYSRLPKTLTQENT